MRDTGSERVNAKVVWISWERHRRTRELARHFGIELHELTSKLPRILKYPVLTTKTYALIRSVRPAILFVQNPSVVLSLLCCGLKSFFGFKLVVDLHNGAIVPESRLQRTLSFLYEYVHANSDVNIVTNRKLEALIAGRSRNTIVLPDKMPEFSGRSVEPNLVRGIDKYYVAICTFEADEPFPEIVEAGRLLGNEIKIVLTGNHHKCSPEVKAKAPNNVLFSGYLPEEEYVGLLLRARGVIDLTKRDDCLVCGAYEAVALGKPMILSGTEALREYFQGGALFCRNDKASIASSVREMEREHTSYSASMPLVRDMIVSRWTQYEDNLTTALAGMVRG